MANPLILPAVTNSIVAGDDPMGNQKPPFGQPKRRGLFGGKIDMEDFQMALARAAAYFQGDYEGAAAITGQMSKTRQNRINAAQLATMLAQDTTLTDQQRRVFAMDPEGYFKHVAESMKPPEHTNSYKEYIDAGYTDAEAQAQLRLDAASRRQKIVTTTEGGAAGTYSPDAGYNPILMPNPGDKQLGAPVGGDTPPSGAIGALKANPSLAPQFDAKYGPGAAQRYLGGGVSNGTGGFRP